MDGVEEAAPATQAARLLDPISPGKVVELKVVFDSWSVEEAREDPLKGIVRVKCMDSDAFADLCALAGISNEAGRANAAELVFESVKNPVRP
jgi:hypothetical protein